MNDWSFTQLCQLAKVSKDTVNRLTPETAERVFAETLPAGNRPVQVLTQRERVRAVHGAGYHRLWNADLLSMLSEFAVDFRPPAGEAAAAAAAADAAAILAELRDCAFRMRAFCEASGGDFALGVETGMQRCAEMVENLIRRHTGGE